MIFKRLERDKIFVAKDGFSIIEILIVIAIVGGLLAATLALVNTVQYRAALSSTQTKLRTLKTAIISFYADFEQYPQVLADLVKKPQGEGFDAWEPRYLDAKDVPKDGWGRKFSYKLTPSGKHEYELTTKTPKGATLSVWDL